jgi:hypothetical protein
MSAELPADPPTRPQNFPRTHPEDEMEATPAGAGGVTVRSGVAAVALDAEGRRLLGAVRLPAPGGVVAVRDYAVTVLRGELVAGDDAAQVRWVTAEEFAALPTTPGLIGYLTAWGTMPR